ncbi:DUF6457 domain-containing protein [Dactylosporangium salmoneum]|uniref:DUF6457 domain-containing protein n=1 Tax=Dactylosporangium salmoneum TaxID=53361 RepID=A0ABP5TRC2_9ACTN
MTTPGPEGWLSGAAGALDVPAPSPEQNRALLDLVRAVAHGVARPAGPLAAYLAGVAVGRGTDLDAACAALAVCVPGEAP